MPSARARAGEAIRTAWPPTRISPDCAGVMPKIVCANSLRPEPTSPARPTISPARTDRLMPRVAGRRTRSRTSSTGAPIGTSILGNSCSMRRPTIICTSSPASVSATRLVPT